MGTGDVCWVPPAAVRHGRARPNSGTKTMGVQDYGVAKLLNVVLTPVAYSEVKVQVRDLMRVVGIAAPFAPLVVGTRKISFY